MQQGHCMTCWMERYNTCNLNIYAWWDHRKGSVEGGWNYKYFNARLSILILLLCDLPQT